MEGKNPQKKQIAKLEMDEDGISVPNWLFEVLAWISRIEMANSQLSFSCKLFKQICFPKLHGNVKPHKIKMLEFCGGGWWNSGYLHLNDYNQPLPIPNVPPSYILGIKRIYIHFLDDQLLEFVQNILPQFNQIKFAINLPGLQSWKQDDKGTKIIKSLLDLLANKIVKYSFEFFELYSAPVSEFNRLFPGFIQKVDYLGAYPFSDEFDILFDWLAFPPINGEKQQKILDLQRSFANRTDKFVDRIKEEFSNANEHHNYFIKCPVDSRVAHFNMENEKTGEILTLYRIEEIRNYNYIVRCPKNEEDFWKKEGEMKMRKSLENENANDTYILAQIDRE